MKFVRISAEVLDNCFCSAGIFFPIFIYVDQFLYYDFSWHYHVWDGPYTASR